MNGMSEVRRKHYGWNWDDSKWMDRDDNRWINRNDNKWTEKE